MSARIFFRFSHFRFAAAFAALLGGAEAAQADPRCIAFIASCDWSHTHRQDGIYGYHPAAKEMDALVVQAIKDDNIMSLIDLDPDFVRDAAIDGLWQLLMLEGAKQVTPLTVDFLSYEQPSYFSMIVALYDVAVGG